MMSADRWMGKTVIAMDEDGTITPDSMTGQVVAYANGPVALVESDRGQEWVLVDMLQVVEEGQTVCKRPLRLDDQLGDSCPDCGHFLMQHADVGCLICQMTAAVDEMIQVAEAWRKATQEARDG